MILKSGIIAATDVEQRTTEYGQKPNSRQPSINQIQDAYILIQLPLKANTNSYRRGTRTTRKNQINRTKRKQFLVRQQQWMCMCVCVCECLSEWVRLCECICLWVVEFLCKTIQEGEKKNETNWKCALMMTPKYILDCKWNETGWEYIYLACWHMCCAEFVVRDEVMKVLEARMIVCVCVNFWCKVNIKMS